MATIRVDPEVFSELERRVQGFSDTPNLVLRRLLGLEAMDRGPAVAEPTLLYNARLGGFRRGRPPTRERRYTPQRAFRRPILEAVEGAGGEASAREVLDIVGQTMEGSLLAADHEPMSNGEPRWRVTASFERKNLVEEGLLDASAPRGVWRLTDRGSALLERERPSGPAGWGLEEAVRAVERLMGENRAWLREMANR